MARSRQWTSSRVAVLARSEQLIRAIEAGAPEGDIIRCGTAAQLAAIARSERLAGVVYEAAFDGRGPHTEVVAALSDMPCEVLVAVTGAAGAIRDLVELTRHEHSHIAYVVAFPDEVQRSVARMVARGNEPTAVPHMMERVLPLVASTIRSAVAAAVVLTQGHATVEQLVRVCRVASSTMRSAFGVAGVAPPKIWVGTLRSTHAIWRTAELGCTMAIAARRGGFVDPTGLAHCVRHYTGHSLSDWRVNGGFSAALDVCGRRCLSPASDDPVI